MNKLLTYALMLDLFIVLHIPFVTMLTEFKKVLCQELVFVQQDYHSTIRMNYTTEYGC